MTALAPLAIAVVGHTNTGKTSLLRTLTRDEGFGEVSDHPATTRHVEGAVLLLDGRPAAQLWDTPGLEDSIRLLERLDAARTDRSVAWVDVVRRFLDEPATQAEFDQEVRALRQVLASDAALYVVDARDRVLGKHRDELEILARCARPVVPVLNFTARPEADEAAWREALTRAGLHVIVAFDTVVVDGSAERRLLEALRVMLEPFQATLDALIADRAAERAALERGAAELVADLLVDVAAYAVMVVETDRPALDAAMEALRASVRAREQRCVDALLALFGFRAEDCMPDALPLTEGRWGHDLFAPDSLRQFGIRAGSAAAVGGLAGLTVDAMTGGLSLGAAAALGAAAGALWSTFDSHGRRLVDMARGYTELRVQDTTLRLLAARQIDLVHALLRRGHASQERIRLAGEQRAELAPWIRDALPQPLREARLHPQWSALGGVTPAADAARIRTRDALADVIAASVAT